MNKTTTIKYIADTYGITNQLIKLQEESAEVIQAICKIQTIPSGQEIPDEFTHKLIEEIADLKIMLEQVEYLLKCSAEIATVQEYKITRQVNRIMEMYSNK